MKSVAKILKILCFLLNKNFKNYIFLLKYIEKILKNNIFLMKSVTKILKSYAFIEIGAKILKIICL